MLKSALGLRPNFHQIEKHVEGHIFIRILALPPALLDTAELATRETGERSGGGSAPTALVTTRLPLKDGRIINLRKPSLPDAAQAHVYQLLGIDWKTACPSRQTELKKATSSTTADTQEAW
jgi:hypothetical protein